MKSIASEFQKTFSEDNLKKIYDSAIAQKKSSGVDNISIKVFEKNLGENIEIINKKVLSGKYSFTRYKQKLISKGPEKPPREVCIPTLRDSLTLKALSIFLQNRLSGKVDQPLPQKITKEIKTSLREKKYDWVIKLDISNFYPSVRHKILRRNLRNFIKNEDILELIDRAISQTTKKGAKSEKGIPQGLPISNILAALYFRNLDNLYKKKSNLFYQRYVDDIIILCKKEDAESVTKDIIKRCKNIGLTIYDPKQRSDKSLSYEAWKEFSYLGYRYNPSSNKAATASTGQASKQKLIDSITGIFTAYYTSKKRSIPLLQWRINLRITGCISENKGKGWIFFFSEIDDKTILYQLDSLVESLKERFKVDFETKRFIRAWHEINHNRWRKRYFPNFDKYDVEEMSKIITTYKGTDPKSLKMDDFQIRDLFWKLIKKEIKDMDSDIQPFS
ncbi:reverse transcriptase domain-containing protein [Marinobacter sp. PE14]